MGGDDLVVMLPARLALSFAGSVAQYFEQISKTKLAGLSGREAKFFKRLQGRGVTISCGVALARANYPFYLLLDLAEDLLKSAKRAGADQSVEDHYWSPAHVDFHLVTGSSSHDLAQVRRESYGALRDGSDARRTLRPYSLGGLDSLRRAVARLRSVNFPRSKLQALHEAALEPMPHKAEYLIREIFSRCRRTEKANERLALWEATELLGPVSDFPWTGVGGDRRLGTTDLAEAFDLFPE